MQTIHVATTLPTSADRVWRAMQSTTTMLYVCRGLFGMPALNGRSEPFHAGERGSGRLWAFHVIPAYRHTIEVTGLDHDTRTIRTHEHGGVLTAWDHTLLPASALAQACPSAPAARRARVRRLVRRNITEWSCCAHAGC